MTETPRERRAARTRQAILDAAIDIIRREGLEKFSLRKVARHIDYSPAGLYEYFGSVDEMLAAVCRYSDERMVAYLRRVPDDLPTDEMIVEGLMAYIAYARENPNLFVLNFTRVTNGITPEPQPLPDSIAQFDPEDTFRVLYGYVTRAAQAGLIVVADDADQVQIAYTLWAHAHGMAMIQAAYLPQAAFDYTEANRQGLWALVRGLHPDANNPVP